MELCTLLVQTGGLVPDCIICSTESCSRVLVFLDPLSSLVRGVTRLLVYQIAQVTHTSSSTTYCPGTKASSVACVVTQAT